MKSKRFPGDLDALSPIRDFIMEISSEAGLDKKATYNLCLAVDEVVTNIVNYGYNEKNKDGYLDVFSKTDDTKLIVYVEDDAEPYDPRNHELPDDEDLQTPLEEREIGGLGVFLAFTSVDKFDYEYVNGRNRNIFVVNLPNK